MSNSSRMSASESYVGKYTKQKLLGKGTFGEAWLVVSTASGRGPIDTSVSWPCLKLRKGPM